MDSAAPLNLDLYDDLYSGEGLGDTLLRTQLAELQGRARAQEAQAAELRQQVEALTRQVTAPPGRQDDTREMLWPFCPST